MTTNVAQQHPGVPVAARVLLREAAGRWLLVWHVTDGFTAHLPGGLVEPGESPRAAALRELREEAGLLVDASLTELFAVVWVPARTPGRRGRLEVIFTAVVDPRVAAAAVPVDVGEVARLEWAWPDRAVAVLHPVLAAALAGVEGPAYREIVR